MKLQGNNSKNCGFTTIELAIVIVISGLMFTGLLSVYQTYKLDLGYKKTVEHIEKIDSSLKEYLWSNNTYPCPADPTLLPTHPDYGVSVQCGLGAGANTCAVQRPNLTNAGVESNVACAESTVDRNVDGIDDMVLIGAFPFRTFQDQAQNGIISDFFREVYTYDGYDMRYTYAVSANMAAPATFSYPNMVNPHFGAITVVDENGLQMTEPPNSAHYVIVSHGANKRGAYSPEGVQNQNCLFSTLTLDGIDDPALPGNAAAGLSLEIENCDHIITNTATNNDAAFRKAIRSKNEGNPSFFDDIVYYKFNFETSLWQTATNSAAGRQYQYATNLGNVGIGNGLNTPAAKLHVGGDVMIEKRIESQNGFCNPDARDATLATPPECMQVEFIAGNTTSCGPNEVAVAIAQNGLICEPLFNAGTPTFNALCGQDVSDLDSDGDVTEQLFATSITYNRSTNVITANCTNL